jgi:hypothetical protein
MMEQPFNVVNDPRNAASTADLKEQFDLNTKICAKLNEIAKGTAQIKKIKTQIDDFLASLKDSATAKPFKDRGKEITDALDSIKNDLFNEKIQANEDDLRFPIELEEKLATLNAMLQSSDTKPTASMYTVYNSLAALIDIQLKKIKDIVDTKVPAFNTMAEKVQKKAIDARPED